MSPVKRFEHWCDRWSDRISRVPAQLVLILAVLCAFFLTNLGADPDLFARVGMGKLVQNSGTVPLVDPFAFSPKKELWIDHEWLAGVVFYLVSQQGGDLALFLFKCGIAALSVLLLSLAQSLTFPLARARPFWLLLAVMGASVVWTSTVRAQVFTYLFLPWMILVQLLVERGRGRWLVLTFPPMLCFWANAHGGFVVGLGFLACITFGELVQRRGQFTLWMLCSLASGTATLLTPYGLLYWEFMFDALSMKRQHISEWAMLDPLSGSALILLCTVAVVVIPVLRREVRIRPGHALFLIAALLYGMRHVRLLPIFAMASAVYGLVCWEWCVAWLKSRAPERFLALRRALSCFFVLLSAGCAVRIAVEIFRPGNFQLNYSSYPVAAFQWLTENRVTGNLLVDFNRGSYALWRLYPDMQISLDGRYEEVYPESTVELVSQAMNPDSAHFSSSLQALNPSFIILDRDAKTDATVEASFAPWRIRYRDESFVLLSRSDLPFTEIAEGDSTLRERGIAAVWQPRF